MCDPSRRRANAQTELVWRWMHRHPDLMALFRVTARDAAGDVAGHVTDYLLPIHASHDQQAELAHIALAGADWIELRRRLNDPSPGDGIPL